MINLTDCKTPAEALDKLARAIGYGEIVVKVIVFDNLVKGLDFETENMKVGWRIKNK